MDHMGSHVLCENKHFPSRVVVKQHRMHLPLVWTRVELSILGKLWRSMLQAIALSSDGEPCPAVQLGGAQNLHAAGSLVMQMHLLLTNGRLKNRSCSVVVTHCCYMQSDQWCKECTFAIPGQRSMVATNTSPRGLLVIKRLQRCCSRLQYALLLRCTDGVLVPHVNKATFF